jgi:hypothetical protein
LSTRNLPTGLLARVQRSGRTFFYFRASPNEKEVPLGNDLEAALARYQFIQKDQFLSAQGKEIRVLDLLAHFQRCSTPPAERHGRMRRKSELKGLVNFFTDIDNPVIVSIPAMHQFEQWSLRRNEVRSLDSVRLFRNIWRFFVRHNYIEFPCPWTVTGQYHERVTLELIDILYPYADTPLREVLEVALRCSSDESALLLDETSKKGLLHALRKAKDAACFDLKQSFRNDLLPALHNLSSEMLNQAILSATRIKNLPIGKINLNDPKRQIIASARQRVAINNSNI